jgi:energy-coupling factor transporter ATP-binding protein EcfA2
MHAELSNLNTPFPITSIRVTNLFGRYDYAIPSQDGMQDFSKLMILYGDNGCGKTTILKLLFWLLATHPTRGYKSNIARVPFKSFQVTFGDGTVIKATKHEGLQGPFTTTILRNGMEIAQTTFDTRTNYSVPKDAYEKTSTQEFLHALRQLDLSVYFLNDERRIDATMDPAPDDEPEEEEIYVESLSGRLVRHGRDRSAKQTGVASAMRRATDWITRQAISDSNLGEENANFTYSQIIRKLAEAPMSTAGDHPSNMERLCEELEALERRTRSFTKLGLLPALETQDIQVALRNASEDRWLILYKVLKPYIDVARERLNARQEVSSVVERFMDNVNSFLWDKEVSFNLQSGFQILVNQSQMLTPDQLSSGEKQLLMLLCNTLAARSHASIFLIDEPELSLNVKWQRQLIPALLDSTSGSRVQFILASHSLQMLAQHKTYISKLRGYEND